MMPQVGFKRQATPGTCPSGYQFYNCNNAQVVWTGCCAQNPCTNGCSDDAQPDDDDDNEDDVVATSSMFRNGQIPGFDTHAHMTTATQSSPSPTTFATVTSGSSNAAPSVLIVLTGSSSLPSVAETAAGASPTSTALGENVVPSDVTDDPATQTITGYEDAKDNEPKSPPHTEKDDVPAIIGATLGAVGIVMLISLLFFCYRRRNRKKEQRRRVVGPYKREIDQDDNGPGSQPSYLTRKLLLTQTDVKHTSIGGGSIRSRPRPHTSIVHDSRSYHGSTHEMRSVDGASTRGRSMMPPVNEHSPAKPPGYQHNDPHELEDTTSPPRNDSAAQPDLNNHASASLSDGDPTSWSRYSTHLRQDHSNASGTRAPSRSPSRSPARNSSVNTNRHTYNDNAKPNPYTGETRTSRATGSTFTPANGATTAPTIKISAA